MTLNKIFSKYSDWSLIFLRLGIGIVFLVHGVQKLLSVSGTAGFFAQLGIPAPLLFTWIVTLVEAVGGLFLIIGFLTRWSALLLSINILVAIFLVHLKNGFFAANGGYEFALVLLLGALALLFSGPGKKLALEKSR